jgi:Tol biopolymer transport system component
VIGRSLSHYKVLEELSRGGMGIVYRARDVKLDREVAVKVLPPELVSNEERKRRFLQEARAAASLQHPNIAVIHEVDEVAGVTFLVMELIDGEKLSDRLARERLSFSRALALAGEIADGLSQAHGRGIVHRDVKPGNVMLTRDGHPKIIDFGLAKLLEPLGDLQERPSDFETAARVESRAGQVMGTLAYMSPEQARGRTIDHRSDLFSLGIVLYEMVTGTTPFTAASAAELPHAIIHDAPKPLGAAIQAPTAPEMQRIVSKCLAKDPEDRYQSARDLYIDLRNVKRDSESQPSVLPTTAARKAFDWRIPLIVAGVLGLAALGFLLLRGSSDAPLPRVVRTFQLTRDPGLEADPAISPDGKLVAYARGPVGETKIYVQQVSGGRAVPLTADFPGFHFRPRWSPDGSRIAFTAVVEDRVEIDVVTALGGAPRRITDWGIEPTWSPDGDELAYRGGTELEELLVVSVQGGEPRRLAERLVDSGGLLWDRRGNRLVYASGNSTYLLGANFLNPAHSSLWTISAEGGEPVRLTEEGHLDASPVFTSDGAHILFVSTRGGSRDIYRIGMSPSGEPTGPPERLTTGLNVHSISLSADDRTLAYSVVSVRQNVWSLPIPSEGPISAAAAVPVTVGNQVIEVMNVSPDRRWLAFDSDRSGNQDIFKMPLEGGEPVQLTSDPAGDCCPAWSPDGTRIAFHSHRSGNRDVFVMSADGGSLRQLTNHPGHDRFPTWAPDGKRIAFSSRRTGPDRVFTISADRGEVEGEESRPLTEDEFSVDPAWSPDGRWLAVNLSSGLSLIPSEGGEPRTLVRQGGYTPIWSSDGHTLYYREAPELGIWKISISGGEPELLVQFDDPAPRAFLSNWASDGKGFYFTLTEHEGDIWVMELH